MRLIALLALLALGLVVGTAAPVGAVTVFQNSKVAVGIADGWVQDTDGLDDNVIGQWSIDDQSAIFQIVALKVPDGTSSTNYAVQQADALSTFNGYTKIRRDFIKCADQDCPLLDYTVIDKNGETQRIQQAFVTKGADGWVLIFRTRASDAELMVYSFTI